MKTSSWVMGIAMALGATPAIAQPKAAEIVVAELFCQLAKGGEQLSVQYLLTKPLLELVRTAQAKSDEIQIAHPDEKPPLGDGVPYQSFPDVAPICRPGEAIANSETTAVFIHYEFPDTPGANWTDRLRMKWEDGLLKIDDVRYGPDHETGLRSALAEMFPK